MSPSIEPRDLLELSPATPQQEYSQTTKMFRDKTWDNVTFEFYLTTPNVLNFLSKYLHGPL